MIVRFMDTIILISAVITAASTAAIAVELIFDWSVVWPELQAYLRSWGLGGATSTAQL
ncbi:MAG: hypothetical protein AAF530_12505 [Pseudomonadota bacterium]